MSVHIAKHGQFYFIAPEKLGAHFWLHAQLGILNQSAHQIKKQLKILLVIPFDLFRTFEFHFEHITIQKFS